MHFKLYSILLEWRHKICSTYIFKFNYLLYTQNAPVMKMLKVLIDK